MPKTAIMVRCKLEISTILHVLLAIYLLVDRVRGLDGKVPEIKRTPAELVRSRGYQALDHNLTTSDGYILNLIQAKNPLTNSTEAKDVLLVVHGSNVRAEFFLGEPAEQYLPKDYSNTHAANMSQQQLEHLLAGDPAANSIVYLALNFGHQVWLLNRRGTPESRAHISQDRQPLMRVHTTASKGSDKSEGNVTHASSLGSLAERPDQELVGLNPEYWNYSLDEQAKIDIPEAVAYVLEQTKRDKLAYLGHSTGASLALMTLSILPNMTEKFSKVILWAPTMYLEHIVDRHPMMKLAPLVIPLLEALVGPSALLNSVPIVKTIIANLCNFPQPTNTTCPALLDLILGPSDRSPSMAATDVPEPINSREIVQFIQASLRGKMHMYDYRRRGNLRAYGQAESPVYNVSQITSRRLSVWFASEDTIVTAENVKQMIGDMTVPVQSELISLGGAFFDQFHLALHSNVAELLNIPTLRVLERE